MSRGDHVYVRRRRHYSHHGIDCGDGTVIHYAGDRGSLRRVERTSWDEFAAGDEVHVRSYRTRLPVEDIVRNAESRLGTDGYHLVRNNCEHFATWSSTGSKASSQVRKWAVAAPGAVASVSVADAAGAHLMLLGTLSMGAYALAKPLRRARHREKAGTPDARTEARDSADPPPERRSRALACYPRKRAGGAFARRRVAVNGRARNTAPNACAADR